MNIVDRAGEQSIARILTTKKRIIFRGGIYHVTQRAPGSELVFLEDRDRLRFLRLLKDMAKRYSVNVFCFVLMSNHVHLLIQINEENLSHAMKHLFERYAMFFNKKYKRKGHVFCGRFRAAVCFDDAYLLAASLYIHANPVRAGLCEFAKNFRWSSIKLYIEPRNQNAFVNARKVLDLIDNDAQAASRGYLNLLESNVIVNEKERTHDLYNAIRSIKKIILHFKSLKHFQEKDQDSQSSKREEVSKRRKTAGDLFSSGYSRSEIQETLNISRSTLYRCLNKK